MYNCASVKILSLDILLKMAGNETKLLNFFHTNKTVYDSSGDFQVSAAQIIKAVAYVVIMALSLSGNTLVLAVVKKNIGQQMRSVRIYLLTSMAVADLIITVGSMPERLTRALTKDEWLINSALGTALCKATNFFEKLSLSSCSHGSIFGGILPAQKVFYKLQGFYSYWFGVVSLRALLFSNTLLWWTVERTRENVVSSSTILPKLEDLVPNFSCTTSANSCSSSIPLHFNSLQTLATPISIPNRTGKSGFSCHKPCRSRGQNQPKSS